MKNKKSTIFISVGLIFLLAAMALTGYNLWDESRADQQRVQLLEEFQPKFIENQALLPDPEKYPKMEMPVKEMEGNFYIGVLEIPYLNLELPIMSEWSYPDLKIAPCRYKGSAYLNNLIIAAHNYKCHFGYLKSLPQGECLTFTDVDGNIFRYEVTEMEIIGATDFDGMESGEWDLTLFTCTYGGQDRVTVRCARIGDS